MKKLSIVQPVRAQKYIEKESDEEILNLFVKHVINGSKYGAEERD